MKYIIICAAATAMCLLAAIGSTKIIQKYKPLKKGIRIFLTIFLTIGYLAAASFAYLQIYYHALPDAGKYLQGDDTVKVLKTGNGYQFDGPGEEDAIVFYPGAKVEAIAYAPLLYRLALEGKDCFLVEMPFRMALLDSDAIENLMDSYSYKNWYLMGHSLGGTVGSMYISDHPENVKGLILLAAYPSRQLDENTMLLSVYGSEDLCLNRDAYDEAKKHWPKQSEEVIISGGNHSGFGDYGHQEGDGQADISVERQWQQTVDAIITWMTP